MTLHPMITKAVEQLGYSVTVGDVAAQAGLDVNVAQRELLVLATETGAHLQVAETGDVIYQFPKNLQAILRNKFWQLRLQVWGQRLWRIVFYLIRISFGLLLITSIILIFLTIALILIALSSSRGEGGRDSDRSSSGNLIFLPNFWVSPDIWWVFFPDYDVRRSQYRQGKVAERSQLNFLEGIFSFLFGDGNPNSDLEDRRWQNIATVIRNHRGAVVAEQIAPYLDHLGEGYAKEFEDYMLPVLSRFDGRPEVSPEGELVYHFPALQVSLTNQRSKAVEPYLQERYWEFSQASSGQKIGAIALGSLNLIGALMLGALLRGGEAAAALGGLVAFVQSIYWLLLGYGIAFLGIPLVRYGWLQQRNQRIAARNHQRQTHSIVLEQASEALQRKLAYAQQFAAERVLDQENIVYTTEKDLLEQAINQQTQIDADWQRRIDQTQA